MKIKWTLFLLLIALILNAKDIAPTSKDTILLARQAVVDQTNLALRQLGHQLLLLEGNDSVAIMPVQQVNDQTFLLPIAQSFDYDTLPFLLHQALTDLGMNDALYYVAVKDCASDTLILGYDVRQFYEGRVPCIGRHQYANCNHIYVTFPSRKMDAVLASHNWFYLLFLSAFIGISFYYFLKKRKAKPNISLPRNKSTSINRANQLLSIGQSQLDVTNQLIYIKNQPISLTFREMKLLHYFVQNAGQLLTRAQLLEKVWAEEGIIVGRSLDVFVSRLRKILKADDSLVIKTVHGVGYRLEIKQVSDTLA